MSVDKASGDGIHTSCVNIGSQQTKLSMEWNVGASIRDALT